MSDILNQKQETELETSLGKIKVKVPTLPKRLDIERRRSMYAGGFVVLSNLGADLAEYFAFLDVVMLECSSMKRRDGDSGSWNYDELSEIDFEKLEDAYAKASEWLNSFRNNVGRK
jgi:hypothetical protein